MLPLLTPGSRLTFVGGKGGVGKTTTAAALAIALADAGERVLVLSVDPAHSLADALDTPLGAEETDVPGVPALSALEVDADSERERFLSSHRGTLLELILRGTYLDPTDVEGFLDLTVPGMDELAALLRLMSLLDDPTRRLVVDTAPTGHTLRLLELPRIARGWLGALEAMEEKHQSVAAALGGSVREDEVADLLRSLDSDLQRLSSLLTTPDETRFLLVTTREPVVLAETLRYQERLAELGIGLAGIVVNRSSSEPRPGAEGGGMVFVPRLTIEPRGTEGLRRFAGAARATPGEAPAPGDDGVETVHVGEPYSPPLDRFLYLVGGKGGVGKSTAASALAALLAAEREGSTLLLSVDPAGSLGDVLKLPVGREPVAVPGAEGLLVQQVDAVASWNEFREQYREETERLFTELLGSGLSAEADRRVVERLVDLAPPGLDELVALLEVIDFIEDHAYNALVIDTAPTGHLLRLLEMPGVALEWAHSVLRLLLKYREVAGLGSLAERVLKLSRSLRALRDLLTHDERTWFLVVALPEALSVPETRRLLPRLRELGIQPGAVLVNRLLPPEGPISGAREARALISLAPDVEFVGAPVLRQGPSEVPALLEFIRAWRRITTTPKET